MDKVVKFMTSDYNVARVQKFFGVESDDHHDLRTSEELLNGKVQTAHDATLDEIDGNANSTTPDLRVNNGSYHRYNLRSGKKPNKHGAVKTNAEFANETSTETPSTLQRKHASEEENDKELKYKINSKLWFYVFHFGALLGNETFLIAFLPWCWWNMSEWLTRRVIVMWVVVMYFGQSTKDIVRWPRPRSPPVAKLENLYWNEFGMPSTHAMMAVCIPFTMLNLTMDKYQYPFSVGVAVSITWCCLVCCSRLYLGMHNFLDLLVGVIFSTIIMYILLPYLDIIDEFFTQHVYGAAAAFSLGLGMVICYPTLDRWSNARADATLIVGVGVGVLVGKWFKNEYGIGPVDITEEPPYNILVPNFTWLVFMLLRSMLGWVILLTTKEIVSSFICGVIGFLLGISRTEAKSTEQLVIELPRKFFAYIMVAINATVLCPWLFVYLGLI
ncbi:sphingosine-1-phosphate phosphatase 2-like [Glandiceps talaboti]